MRLVVSPSAERDLGKLSREVVRHVTDAIDKLSENSRPPGCLLLRDYQPPTWRIRVGDWRILYEIDDHVGLVRIRNVYHHSRSY